MEQEIKGLEQSIERLETALKPVNEQKFYEIVRNTVIEEVAQHIEKLTGFGQDTISSFAIYIRAMKK